MTQEKVHKLGRGSTNPYNYYCQYNYDQYKHNQYPSTYQPLSKIISYERFSNIKKKNIINDSVLKENLISFLYFITKNMNLLFYQKNILFSIIINNINIESTVLNIIGRRGISKKSLFDKFIYLFSFIKNDKEYYKFIYNDFISDHRYSSINNDIFLY